MTRVAIIGTGDLAYGLSRLYSINNTASSANVLEVTKPNLGMEGTFHDTGVPLTDFDDTLIRAEVLILAIPSMALKDFVIAHQGRLNGKVLVDATNSYKPGQDLATILQGIAPINTSEAFESNIYDQGPTKETEMGFRWVKAFNDVGAIDMLLRKPYVKTKLTSKMCSNSSDALEMFKSFVETSMGFDIKVVPIEQYNVIYNGNNSLGKEWMTATWTIIGVFLLNMLYNMFRHVQPIMGYTKSYPIEQFPLFVMNKSVSWTALWGFAIAMVPGILAHIHRAWHQDSLIDKPTWLKNYLACRKELGLVSLYFLGVHMVMSALMFSIAYYDRFFKDPEDPLSRMTVNGESSFMFGSFAFNLYVLMGVCSLPCVAQAMTRGQWSFVYGPVAWTALVFGTCHVMCQGIGVTWGRAPWPNTGYLPPVTLMACLLPWLIMALKIFQVIFVWVLETSAKKKVAKNWTA